MIEFRFEINGKSVDPTAVTDELERGALLMVRDHILQTVRGILCPKHLRPAEAVVARGTSLDDLKVDVTTCCEQLRSAVDKAFPGST